MLVSKAIHFMNTIISSTVDEYKTTDESKDISGNYIQHPLETKTDESKLEALYFGLRDASLNTTPFTLLENNDTSTATEFKKISTTQFIRVPNEPSLDGNLDIDEGLSFAVIYKALSFLWSGYISYSSEAEAIYANFNDVARDYFMKVENNDEFTSTIYFRYSSDGINFHDNFQDGDIYISFKQGDGVWSNAIRFVGSDGTGGASSVASFLDLTDTPTTYTAGKFLAVNSTADGIIEVDAPSSGVSPQPFDGMNGVSGNIAKNFKEIVGNYFYVDVAGDLSFDITQTDNVYDIELGKLYTIEFIPNGHNITLPFNALGDKTIDSSKSIVMIDILFDSIDIYIMANRGF